MLRPSRCQSSTLNKSSQFKLSLLARFTTPMASSPNNSFQRTLLPKLTATLQESLLTSSPWLTRALHTKKGRTPWIMLRQNQKSKWRRLFTSRWLSIRRRLRKRQRRKYREKKRRKLKRRRLRLTKKGSVRRRQSKAVLLRQWLLQTPKSQQLQPQPLQKTFLQMPTKIKRWRTLTHSKLKSIRPYLMVLPSTKRSQETFQTTSKITLLTEILRPGINEFIEQIFKT